MGALLHLNGSLLSVNSRMSKLFRKVLVAHCPFK